MAHSHDPSGHDAHAHDHSHPGLAVEVERTGPCVASVRLRVTAEEFQRSRAQGLKTVAKRTRLKGFRPGKVPIAVVERQFGQEVEREVVEHFLQHAFDTAVQENELRPATRPRIDLESVRPPAEGDWEHEFEILLRPDVELGKVEGLEVEGQPVDVAEEEVDATIDDLRRQLSRPEPTGDEGLPADGMAVCRLEFLRPEVEEAMLDREGIRLSPKTAPRGIDEEAFEAALTGAAVGENRSLEMVFPEDFPVEEARGEKGTCRVTVQEAFRIVPPAEEELYERLDVAHGEEDDPVAGLRAAIRERIEASKQENEEHRLENALLERLLQDHPMEIPEPLVAAQVDAKTDEMRRALEAQGLEPADLEARLEEERRGAFEATSRAMRAVYLIEEIARTQEIQVEQADVERELTAIARRNNADLAEVRNYYQEEGLIQQLAMELLERKVRSFLRETADIKVP